MKLLRRSVQPGGAASFKVISEEARPPSLAVPRRDSLAVATSSVSASHACGFGGRKASD